MFSGGINGTFGHKWIKNNPVEAAEFIVVMILLRPLFKPLQIKEPRHIASFVVSRSIKKLF